MVPLTAAERRQCRVIALTRDYYDASAAGTQTARFAVCVHCPREQWGTIESGEVLIYTELFQFTEEDGPFEEGDDTYGPPRSLVTHVGPLRMYDAQCGLFYACSWKSDNWELPLLLMTCKTCTAWFVLLE